MLFLAICKYCRSQLRAELESRSAQTVAEDVAATPVTQQPEIERHDVRDTYSTNEMVEVSA